MTKPYIKYLTAPTTYMAAALTGGGAWAARSMFGMSPVVAGATGGLIGGGLARFVKKEGFEDFGMPDTSKLLFDMGAAAAGGAIAGTMVSESIMLGLTSAGTVWLTIYLTQVVKDEV